MHHRYTASVDNPHFGDNLISDLIHDRSLAVAESITGGSLAARIVAVPGSSAYFRGGIVAYANDVKQQLLGVEETVLRTRGAVSEECAVQMARGVRKVLGADIGISTTGIAGPDGGTDLKPVGLVYTAIVTPDGEHVSRNVWGGERIDNIALTVEEGIRLLNEYLLGSEA